MEIGLIGDTKEKRDEPAVPAKLYSSSNLFRKASTYADQHHDGWYVLSAKHHLLHPEEDVIEPYDQTLSDTGVENREEWAQKVFEQLEENGHLVDGYTFVFHAGEEYYEQLLPLLDDSPVDVELPVEGLKIGERLAWYNERI